MAYLQVIYQPKTIGNNYLHSKEFTLEQTDQAFNLYWRMHNSQIVLRQTKQDYEPSFTEATVQANCYTREAIFYLTKQDHREIFLEWLKEQLDTWDKGK